VVGFNFTVVGGGLQGRAAASNLSARTTTSQVVVLDAQKIAVAPHSGVEFVKVDVLRERARALSLIKRADACLVALPGSLADRVLPLIAGAGVPTVDVSFTPDARNATINAAAKRAGIPVVRDVGVAPGLSHILAAGAAEDLGGLSSLTIYVGGLPQRPPANPFRHAVYFNPIDLLSEYARPARMRVNGRRQAPDPLDPDQTEQLEDVKLGRLEAFASDGLRTLLSSYPHCPQMREMTLRWPGHLEAMRRLSAAGKLRIARGVHSPHLATAASLNRHFPGTKFPDYLLMEVHAGRGKSRRAFRVLDRAKRGTSAMSRTTAFTAAAATQALARLKFTEPGEHPPEKMGASAAARSAILRDLNEHGVKVGRRSLLRLVDG
jgi:lysine 6-dehydrogenase